MATPALIHSGYATDQNAAGSLTVTSSGATSSANRVFVVATLQNNSNNQSLSANSLSGGSWTLSGPFQDAGVNSDQLLFLWQGGGGSSSFTLTGYTNVASIAFIEVSNFNSVNVYHNACLSFADGQPGDVIYGITNPTVSPAISFLFASFQYNPTSFGTLPAGVTTVVSGPGDGQFHTLALFQVDTAASGSTINIPYNDGANAQGAVPTSIQLNINGAATGGGGGSGGGSGGTTTGNGSAINPPTVGAVTNQSPNSTSVAGKLILG